MNQHIGMSSDHLSATETCRILGISLATLYAYGAFLGVLAIAAWLRPRPGLRSQ